MIGTRYHEVPAIRRTVPPGVLERELRARLLAVGPAATPARRRARGRSRLRSKGLVALIGMLVLGIGAVFAVHDEGFQLEGNVQASDLSYNDIDPGGGGGTITPGTLTGDFAGDFDWDSLFAADTTEIDQSANGFVDQDFVVDFRIGAGPSFDTSDPSTFTGGGSKDINAISAWRCVEANNVTNKGDIINAYAAIYEQNGDRILYFGIEKQEGNGDNNVGLWLLQDPAVGCVEGGSGNGNAFSGVHVPGDLLLVAENTNGGGIASIVAYEWVADLDGNAANGLQPGLDDDNPIAEGADCLDDAVGGDPICATTNGGNINVPWPHAGAVNTVNGLGGLYEKVSFIEGGINLSEFDAFRDTCFTGFLFNTRASQETTSSLFDYALGDIDTCHPELELDKEPETQDHNVGDSFDWTLTVTNTGDGDADDALVTDTIPDGLTIDSATVDPLAAGTCAIDGQDVECTIDVPAGGEVTITIGVTATLDVFEADEGCITVTNTGEVSVDGDTDPSDDSDSAGATICRPLVTKSADGTYTETHTWTVTKAVDPDHHDMNAGQSAFSDYDVTVDETVTGSDFAVSGSISIENPGTVDMTVDVVDELSSGESAGVGDIACDTDGDATADDDGDDVLVEAGETVECTYSIDTTSADPGTNTATVTLNAIDFDATDGYTFSASSEGPTEVDVEDTFDGGTAEFIGTATGDDLFEYDREFTCPTDESLFDENGNYEFTKSNTVEILDGTTVLDSDEATVTVDCWLPVPEKTADGAFDRSWTWTIAKTGDATVLLLAEGQSYVVTYEVDVDATATDADFVVSGSITIDNPNPEDAMTVDVVDELSSGESAGPTDIDCGAAGDGDDAVIPAGGSITCTYAIDHTNSPATSDTGTNSATVTLLTGGADDPEVTATDPYSFALDGETDECIDVTDSEVGFLGTVCADEVPTTFTYQIDVGAAVSDVCGDHTLTNVADFVTNDTGATGDDDHSVAITVECDRGCTLTQGYWKTHSDQGPAPFDDNWDNLPDVDADLAFEAEGETFFLSDQTWYRVFWTAPRGNAYYILAHQYMAAVLNGLNGASTTSVDTALASATTLFQAYTPAQIAALKGNSALRAQFLALAGTLAAYNEGRIGPGHCDEDGFSSL